MQARFTEALLKEKAKLGLPSDRIFSTTVSGQPKSEVLQELEQKHPKTTYHFVEDKLGTLDKVLTNKPCLLCIIVLDIAAHVQVSKIAPSLRRCPAPRTSCSAACIVCSNMPCMSGQ